MVLLLVTITPLTRPQALLHPPTLAPWIQTYSDKYEAWQLATTATWTADIYNVSITFWGKSGDFFVDNQGDYHLEDFEQGSTWAIDTAPLELETATLTEFVPYFDFIDGTKTRRGVFTTRKHRAHSPSGVIPSSIARRRTRRERVRAVRRE